jgi:hypothetical protein
VNFETVLVESNLKLWSQHLKPNPIFDSNIFGNVQDASISESDWRFLIRHRPGHGWPLSIVSALELLAGVDNVSTERFAEAQAQITLAYELSKGRVLEDLDIASFYVDLRDKEQAFRWLNIAYQEHDLGLVCMKTNHYFDSIRSDPRFDELVRKVGLPQ